jgi:hypothetical protein
MQLAFTAAIESGRMLVLRNDVGWTWGEGGGPGRGWSRYFRPLSACDVHTLDDLQTILPGVESWAEVPEVTADNVTAEGMEQHRVLQWKNSPNFAYSRLVPARWKRVLRSTLLYRSMLTSFQVQPNDRVAQYIEEERERIGWASRQLSVHVRAGDKVFGNGYNRREMSAADVGGDEWWADLTSRMERVVRACGLRRVFVATRSPPLVARLRTLQTDATLGPDVLITWDRAQLRYGNGFHTIDLLNGRLNTTDEALRAIRDLVLLADSDVFLGTLESNFSRLAMELGLALRRFLLPVVKATTSPYIIQP